MVDCVQYQYYIVQLENGPMIFNSLLAHDDFNVNFIVQENGAFRQPLIWLLVNQIFVLLL